MSKHRQSATEAAKEVFDVALTGDLGALRDAVMRLDGPALGVTTQAAFNLSQVADLVYAFRGDGVGAHTPQEERGYPDFTDGGTPLG